MEEKWKDVVGYEGLYQVSSIGRILSIKNGVKLSPKKIGIGYFGVKLSKNKIKKMHYIHRLVATVFFGENKNRRLVNHKNHITTDNNVDNIEWVTPSENNQYRIKNKGRSTSVYKGVCFDKERNLWKSAIKLNRKKFNIGRFKTEKEAALAYNKKAKELHGNFAYLNNL